MKIRDLLYRSLKDILRITPQTLFIEVICMLFQSVLVAGNTWLLSLLLNNVYEKKYLNMVICLGSVWGIFILSEVANSVFYSCMIKIDSKVIMQLGMEIGEKGSRMSLIEYENVEVNNKLKRAKNCIEQGRFSDLSLSVFNILSEILKVTSTLMILASFHAGLAIISLLSVIPYFIVRMIRGKEFYELKSYQALKERRRDYLYHLFGDKRSVKELRIFGIEEYIEQKLCQTRDEMNDELWKFKKGDIRSLCWCEILCKAGYITSVFFAILLLIENKLNFGMLASSLSAFASFQLATKYFLISLGRIPECAAFVGDYYSFMDIKEEDTGSDKLKANFQYIKVNNLSFCYPNTSRPAIKDICFNIKENESVAIVGSNGSGKTTLVKLLLGLYRAEKGKIYYGLQDIYSLNQSELHKNISIVSQDFEKYELSVRENIGISDWKNMNDTKRMQKILDEVELDELSSAEHLEMMLGKEFNGRELSIGQWQKLAIARCVFRNSIITVLDEPTAALDPIMEAKILKQFLKIAKGKTAIIVTHRIGICRDVDKIIVMKDGEISEIGNHEELLKMEGEYHKLYAIQKKWYVQ